MADDDQGRAHRGELGLQGFDGQDVEVVGRFVQQQDVRLFSEGASQGRAADFAARQARGRLGRIHAEHVERGFPAMRLCAAQGDVVQQRLAGDLRLLRDVGDAGGRLDAALAVIGLDLASEDLQQGGLARAVATDQAGARTRLHRQVDAVEQHLRPVGETDILKCENGGLHAARDIAGPAASSDSSVRNGLHGRSAGGRGRRRFDHRLLDGRRRLQRRGGVREIVG